MGVGLSLGFFMGIYFSRVQEFFFFCYLFKLESCFDLIVLFSDVVIVEFLIGSCTFLCGGVLVPCVAFLLLMNVLFLIKNRIYKC